MGLASAEADVSPTGVLPYPAVSSHAVLALLVRWGFFAERWGGMRGRAEKQTCAHLLRSLLQVVCGSHGVVVPMALDA